MGNRCYLYIKKEEKEVTLFESNNSLPFFWLLLVDHAALQKANEYWKDIQEEEDVEIDAKKNDLNVNKEAFFYNSLRGKGFLQKHFPEAVPLYTDFVEFIHSNFTEDDRLMVNLSQFSGFYDSVLLFYTALEKDVVAVEKDDPKNISFYLPYDLIAGGSGFYSLDGKAFASVPSYVFAEKTRSTPRISNEQKYSKTSLIIFIFILVICPLFTLLIYKMYKDDGLKFGIILIAILNAGFYLFSLYEIIAQIKSFIRIKSKSKP